jgi:hypothetical protein
VLDQLLATPPPPPPPGVGALEDQSEAQQKLSLRERLEIHRADPSCAVCHAQMDTLGFGLERFDAVGAARDGSEVGDGGGTLPDGRRFAGPRELAVLIAEDPAFPRAFAANLLTFALGRGLERGDREALERIVRRARHEGHRFSAFVDAVVRARPFLERRVASGAPP